MNDCTLAFRIVGPTSANRFLVDGNAAFNGYASCEACAQVEQEAYLSHFHYGDEFRKRADPYDVVNTKGFDGSCYSPWTWWDIDCDGDLERAQNDAQRLVATISNRFEVSGDTLLCFFSGAKGFHVGLPTTLWQPQPSIVFNRVARCFAEKLAELAGVSIDTRVYDKVRAFRAPNSRHPKTGLHKRRLALDELNSCSIDHILLVAREPNPFDLPAVTSRSDQATVDWLDTIKHVERQDEVHRQQRAGNNASKRLNRLTLDFIANGATNGERHVRLFSAAANLAEFNCPSELAHALLTEAALDSCLSPSEVRRQIECGLAALGGGGVHHD